ncbi:hypothetical protein PVAP13_2KG126732 [Panicum virgatum]|uniref:Uncharacterized protein n=1 Tax=Panicum virgatum TaxID=38727 RepID=A0A8T0W4P0_PANVG|nr:hypothetical protein PVAP13_2KG126732 [Panicum virgatum]
MATGSAHGHGTETNSIHQLCFYLASLDVPCAVEVAWARRAPRAAAWPRQLISMLNSI